MKNKIYVLGIICCIISVIGSLFKLLQWPGAGILLTLGITSFGFLFLPFAMINSYRTENNRSHKWLYMTAFLSILIVFTSALFKIQHWPGSHLLLIMGILFPFVLFLSIYLFKNRNDKQINYANYLAILFFFGYIGVMSALLSVGVSRDILNAYTMSIQDLELKSNISNLQAEAIYTYTTDSAKKETFREIRDKTTRVCKEIDDLQAYLVKRVDITNTRYIDSKGKINTLQLLGKDNQTGSEYLIQSQKATALKELLSDYRSFLLSFIPKNENSTIEFVDHALNTMDDPNKTWEEAKFGRTNMIISIEILVQIKTNVNLAALELFSTLEDAKTI